jgi:cytochrome c oxidase cbb3-type subunit III
MIWLTAGIFAAWLCSPWFAAQARAEDMTAGKKLYFTYCTGCHGVTGKGDGPAAKALPVRPADHTDTKKMSQYSDEHLFTVISKGGARVGKSAQMPAWGAVLKEPQIHEIMTYIRTLSMTE